MKALTVFLFLCSMSSAAFGALDTCTSKVLAQASLIEATSQDIVEAPEQAEAAIAHEILTALKSLQEAPTEAHAPIIAELCKNNLSVQKTVAGIERTLSP